MIIVALFAVVKIWRKYNFHDICFLLLHRIFLQNNAKQQLFYLLMILQSGLCSAGQFFGWSYRWALEWLNLVDRSSEDGTQLGCWNDWASPSAFGL